MEKLERHLEYVGDRKGNVILSGVLPCMVLNDRYADMKTHMAPSKHIGRNKAVIRHDRGHGSWLQGSNRWKKSR